MDPASNEEILSAVGRVEDEVRELKRRANIDMVITILVITISAIAFFGKEEN